MTHPRRGAAEAMVRWRSFERNRALAEFAQCVRDAARARESLEFQKSQLHALDTQRQQLAAASYLDLSRLHVLRSAEAYALEALDQRERAVAAAQEKQAHAQRCYLQARADARVAKHRRQQIMQAEADRREKTDFDRLADMYVLTRRDRAHD